MKRSFIEILLDELKILFWYSNCKDIDDNKKLELWTEYLTRTIHRIGEEQK